LLPARPRFSRFLSFLDTSRLALAASRRALYAHSMTPITPSERTTVRRLPDRGHYDAETIHKILDEAFVCHVGFVVDSQPYVIPTNFARAGDRLYLHGSSASRMLRSLAGGIPVCVTVTLVDALVLARSAFHHSVNYRSVVALGRATLVEDPAEKMRALELFTNHILSGRWSDVRPPTDLELKATSVLVLPLSEVSAKVRVGPPKDDEADYALPIWAGILPLPVVPSAPISDPRLNSGLAPPENVRNYTRG